MKGNVLLVGCFAVCLFARVADPLRGAESSGSGNRVRPASPPPSGISFSPTNAPIGTAVTILGENLSGAIAVRFNDLAAVFTVFESQIVATVPAGASTGPITVVTPDGATVSADRFVIMETPPPVIIGFTPASGPPGSQVLISGENLSGATAVQFNGKPALFSPDFSRTNLTATVPLGAASGPLTVITRSGTNTSSAAFTVTVLPPPVVTSFLPTNGPVGARVTILGTNLNDVSAVLFNGQPAADFSAGFLGSSISAIVPAGASHGPITVVTPGGSASSKADFVVTAAPLPVVTEFTPTTGRPGTPVTIHGENLNGVSEVEFNGTPASFSFFGASIFTAVPTGASTGLITVGAPGGAGASANPFVVIDPLAPAINRFTPAGGAEGAIVIIHGEGFTNLMDVKFNDLAADYTVASISQIEAKVPAGATTGPLRVVTQFGTAASASNFYVVANIRGFAPMQGPAGTLVTIIGENFVGATDVRVGGAVATFTTVSPTSINAYVPELATNGTIRVTTPAGTTESVESFAMLPTIGRFEPPGGLAGTEVLVVGSGFIGATQVEFNGVAASFSRVSATELRAVVPIGAMAGTIKVVTPTGSDTTTTPFFVGEFSDLAVVLTGPLGPVNTGDSLIYTTVVSNRGPSAVNNVVLSEQLPAGLNLGFILSNRGNCSDADNRVTCTLGSLAVGATATVKVIVTPSLGPALTFVAQAVADEFDPELANNSARLTTQVRGEIAPVSLAIRRIDRVTVEISWPSVPVDWQLQMSESLGDPLQWAPVTNAPVVGGDRITVLQSTTAPRQFYRLNRP